jgi:hypothetical protein
MIAGAAIAFLPPSRTLVLVIAVGLLGLRLLREAATTRRAVQGPPVTSTVGR